MKEPRPYCLGKKLAESILEMGNLMYDSHRKANFFRGLIYGLLKHKWMRPIIDKMRKWD